MKVILQFLGLAILLLVLLSPVVSAAPSKKPFSAEWKLIAGSGLIGRGRLLLNAAELKKMVRSTKTGYIHLKVKFTEMAKGELLKEPLTVSYYVDSVDFSPTGGFLQGSTGKDLIVCLLRLDEPVARGFYFVGNAGEGLKPYKVDEFAKISREAKNQREISQNFKSLPIGMSTRSDEKVLRLFDRLTKEESQQEAWTQLLRLTRKDIPSIIRVMDDNRSLARAWAYAPNPPGSFEPIAYYGPQKIIDSASLLLNCIACEGFRSIQNGGSKSERAAELDGWRVWSYYNF